MRRSDAIHRFPCPGTALAEDGFVGDVLVAYHEARARAGVGVIVTEAALGIVVGADRTLGRAFPIELGTRP